MSISSSISLLFVFLTATAAASSSYSSLAPSPNFIITPSSEQSSAISPPSPSSSEKPSSRVSPISAPSAAAPTSPSSLLPPHISVPPTAAHSPSSPSPTPTPPVSAPLASPPLPPSDPLVPALFVLGDSTVDAGTNNFLGTLARADHPPYGRDFDTHRPTGRFSNGRTPVDYIAERLGLPLVPSFLGQNGSVEAMIRGVNYASAASGIIFSSGSELGQHVSFAQQVQQFLDTVQHFILQMGEDATAELISESVVYISIGVNDYIHHYFQNASGVQNRFLPWEFSQFLASEMEQEIMILYNMFVRRIVVTGLPPIGCAPHYLWMYDSTNGECIDQINAQVNFFNFVMRRIVADLNRDLPELNIIFCDVYLGAFDIIKNNKQYGFEVISDACCGVGRYNGWLMCMSPEMACPSATNHVWWDQFHPTEAVNAILADNVWNGSHTKMCYPMHLEGMVARSRNSHPFVIRTR